MAETKIIEEIENAADALRRGLIVAFPTETVYGLGVNASDEAAVKRLFEAKGRPSDNPLIVHLGNIHHWSLAAKRLTDSAEALLAAFSPGPITVVVEKAAHISPLVTAGLASVGIRIPGHDQARALLELCDLPIAAPSANRSGRPSCTTWQSVLEDMDGRIDYILRGEVCQVGLESTVVDCTGQSPIILRAGKITLQQLQSVIPTTQMADSILIESDQPLRQASPGVRHPHYQPRAVVKLFESVDELTKLTIDQRGRAAVVGLAPSNNRITSVDSLQGFILNKTLTSLEQYEREFYELLRHVDRCEIESIYLQLVGESDAAAALRDRQLRAAGMK